MRTPIITIFFIFFARIIFAQNNSIDELIQNLYQQQDDINYDEFYETLIQYLNDPIDLNKAQKENLENLYLLNPFQIQAFISYREKAGSLISLYELQAIPGFDKETINKLLPFVTIQTKAYNSNLANRIIKNKNNYLLIRTGIKNTDNENTNSNQGEPNSLFLKYRNFKTNDFSLGFTLKKDVGEYVRLDIPNQYYLFDFISYHFALYNKKFFKSIIIGDYRLQFGQGLVLGGGFNLGKGAETILTTKQSSIGLIPHTSSTESNYFKGIAFTIPLKKLECSIFGSHRFIDGNLDTLSNQFTKITSGYHRTLSELSKRKNILEDNIGSNIRFLSTSKQFQLGITGINTWYNKTLVPSYGLYNYYSFTGKSNYTFGSDFNYLYKNFNFFGEVAISKSGGKGLVAGVLASVTKRIDLALLVRNYNKNFHSFYSNGFSESTNAINEKGTYLGLKIKLHHQLLFSCYFDRFKFPWLKYQVSSLGGGYEYMGRLTYTPTKTSQAYLQLREENKDANFDDANSKLNYAIPRKKMNYLLGFEVQPGKIRYSTRVQYSSTRQNTIITNGFAIMQDLEFNTPKLLIALRLALFQTDDYTNRQYAYERNFIYSYSIPAYYGQGSRFYITTKYRLIKNLDLWFRLARTTYVPSIENPQNNSIEINGMLLLKI